MQVLVIVAMAIIYGISTIVKSRANKAEEEKQKQQQQKRAAGPGKRVRPEQVQPADVKVKRVGPEFVPAVKKVTVKTEKPAIEAEQKFVKKPELAVPKERIEPKPGKMPVFTSETFEKLEEIAGETFLKMPEFTGRAVKQLEKKYAVVPKQKARLEKVEKPLIDFTERNILRSAILHYEILGKPLALREPREF